MSLNIQHRWQAFLAHLGISAIIFAIIYGVTRLVWFPGALFDVSNTWEGIRIVLFVDLVLGPVLTLIVFDRVRKSLKVIARDLVVIAMIQAAGLAGGIWVVHGEKPVLVTLVFDTMHVYTQADLEKPEAREALAKLDDNFPALLYMKLPQERAEARKVIQLHNFVNGPSGAGLEYEHWHAIPDGETERRQMLRFTDKVQAVDGCEKVSVEISSKHSIGRVCVDLDSRSFSLFDPL